MTTHPRPEDIPMMKMPDLWPLSRILCLSRPLKPDAPPFTGDDAMTHDERQELGLLVLHTIVPRWRVYRLNAHDTRLRRVLWSGECDSTVTTYDYKTAEEVYADGWRVD